MARADDEHDEHGLHDEHGRHDGRSAPARGEQYVAIGSSFGAGPGLEPREPGSPTPAGRSAVNYAHLVAGALGLSLTDATFSGATIAEMAGRAPNPEHPVQVEAVTDRTRLVTVTGGGNDVGFAPRLTLASLPWPLRTRSVRRRVAALGEPSARDDAFAGLRENLVALCEAIRERSPSATIVLTDYLTVVPVDPTRAAPPLSGDLAQWGRETAALLSKTIAEVASDRRCVFVSLAHASAEHDAWSADPWTRRFHLGLRGGAPYHPTALGMAKAAELIVATLRARGFDAGAGVA